MKELLELIETVSPNDVAMLDEIDARFYAWYRSVPYHSHEQSDLVYGDCYGKKRGAKLYTQNHKSQPNGFAECPPVTRSRDALKAIRPEGYWFGVDENGTKGWQASMNDPDRSGRNFIITGMPTEELAELHAIIQAIAYERAQ